MEKIVSAPYNTVYIKCHEAAGKLDFRIFKEDISSGQIFFKVGWSLWSFGENFRLTINAEGANKTRVEIISEAAIKAQVYDWGKNDNNISAFFETLISLLKL